MIPPITLDTFFLTKTLDIIKNNRSSYTCYEFSRCNHIKSMGYKDTSDGGIFRQILNKIKRQDLIYVFTSEKTLKKDVYSYLYVDVKTLNSEDGEYIFEYGEDVVILKVDETDIGIANVIDFFPINYVNKLDFGYDIK